MSKFYPPVNAITIWIMQHFVYFIGITLCVIAPSMASAWGITINPRISPVLNNNITLVINNALLKNKSSFTPVGPGGTGIGQIHINLYLAENDNTTILADGVLAEFNDIYSLQVDLNDALKFGNINENLGIQRYSFTLAAERRPALGVNDTLFFNLSRTSQRNYQLEFVIDGFEQTNLIGSLEDSYLNTSTAVNLSGTTRVNFSVNDNTASSVAGRFRLVFKPVSTLPLTILNVAATQTNTNIQVEWKVENEIDMLKYEVEKSTDGSIFKRAATITVRGTNNTYNSYSWIDINAVQGNNFYRIKTYDRSGKNRYSSIVKVTMGKNEARFIIYPNPIKGSVINLQVNNQPAGTYQVRLTNATGQTLYTSRIRTSGGNSIQSLNTGSRLPAGIYQLEIIGQDNNHHTQQLIAE